MPERETEYRPPAARSPLPWAVLVVVVGVAAFFGWRAWQQSAPSARPATPAVLASSPAEPEDGATAAAGTNTDEGLTPLHPLEESTSDAAEPPLAALADADGWVHEALLGLLGSERVNTWLQTRDFVRRVVATVDQLPREHVAPSLWPVRPTPGRMPLLGDGDLRTLSPDNAARYTPFVLLAESVDVQAAAKLYTRLYPLFQQSYEDLGYPGRYFNDRMVAVVDHLLAAPSPQMPLAIRVVEVRGDVPSERPWQRYEFADPRLESLSAGQKVLVRMGPDQAQRLKTVLHQWRAAVTRTPATATPKAPAQ